MDEPVNSDLAKLREEVDRLQSGRAGIRQSLQKRRAELATMKDNKAEMVAARSGALARTRGIVGWALFAGTIASAVAFRMAWTAATVPVVSVNATVREAKGAPVAPGEPCRVDLKPHYDIHPWQNTTATVICGDVAIYGPGYLACSFARGRPTSCSDLLPLRYDADPVVMLSGDFLAVNDDGWEVVAKVSPK